MMAADALRAPCRHVHACCSHLGDAPTLALQHVQQVPRVLVKDACVAQVGASRQHGRVVWVAADAGNDTCTTLASVPIVCYILS